MTISERIETARREQRVLTWVSRAAWRLEQAERERTWALVSARAEGISIRTLGHGDRGCHRPGCTSSWPMPTWIRWAREKAEVAVGPRAARELEERERYQWPPQWRLAGRRARRLRE